MREVPALSSEEQGQAMAGLVVPRGGRLQRFQINAGVVVISGPDGAQNKQLVGMKKRRNKAPGGCRVGRRREAGAAGQ